MVSSFMMSGFVMFVMLMMMIIILVIFLEVAVIVEFFLVSVLFFVIDVFEALQWNMIVTVLYLFQIIEFQLIARGSFDMFISIK